MSLFDGSAASYVRLWILFGCGFLILALLLARMWLVNPILRAEDRTTAAVERQTAALMHLTISPRLPSDRAAE